MRRHLLRTFPLALLTALLMLLAAIPAVGQTRSASRPASVTEMLRAARAPAIKQILLAFHSDDAVMRTNALEAITPIPDRARPLVEMGLTDKSPAVRFAALVTIGKLKLRSLGERARRMVGDPDPSVQAAALFAAHECGLQVDLGRLADLFARPDPTVRGNVAMLLGEMGNPSAAAMMADLSKRPMPRAGGARQAVVRLEVAEAMFKLGDDQGLDVLRAAAYSPYDEVRILAVQTLGRLHDHRMTPAFEQMVQQNPVQLQVAAAEALARMHHMAGQSVVLEAARSQAAAVRAQAAFALGILKTRASIQALAGLLKDRSPQVRLSAAAAVLKALQGPRNGA